jgi:hypothetical protein
MRFNPGGMRFNPVVLIFTVLYFLTSNWILADYFFTRGSKNLLVGGVIILLLIHLVQTRKYNFSSGAVLFSSVGIFSVIFNGFVYDSLLIQHLFLLIFSLFFLTFKNTINIYKLINRVNYVFLLIIPIQMSLFYFDQSLLSHSGPVSSTGFDVEESVNASHWIAYLGSTTNEKFHFLGKILPRFSGYLTEPSAVPNLIFIPLIIEALVDNKKIFLHSVLIIFCIIIFRSGFVTVFSFVTLILLILHRFKMLSKKVVLITVISIGCALLYYLPNIVSLYIHEASDNDLYSLGNKDNTLISRTSGALNMLKEIKPFGNHIVPIHGVGMLLHYLILYGYGILFFLGYLFYKLFVNKKYLIFYILLFDLLFLSKGFSTVFPLLLILSYASHNTSISHKYT